jgi:hypothetical protein
LHTLINAFILTCGFEKVELIVIKTNFQKCLFKGG